MSVEKGKGIVRSGVNIKIQKAGEIFRAERSKRQEQA